jgi:hypothetical protein
METQPAMDASRPSTLRLAGFMLVVAGALVMGVGSIMMWVTVGIAGAQSVRTVSPGIDVAAGIIALICAVVILVLVILSRVVRDSARTAVAWTVIGASTVAAVVSAWFIYAAPDYYSPVDDETLVSALAQATGRSVEEVRKALVHVIDQLGGYTHVGPGPWVVILGAALVIAGGFLTLMWAKRLEAEASVEAAA